MADTFLRTLFFKTSNPFYLSKMSLAFLEDEIDEQSMNSSHWHGMDAPSHMVLTKWLERKCYFWVEFGAKWIKEILKATIHCVALVLQCSISNKHEENYYSSVQFPVKNVIRIGRHLLDDCGYLKIFALCVKRCDFDLFKKLLLVCWYSKEMCDKE